MDFDLSIRFNVSMKRPILALMGAMTLLLQPALTQTRLTPKAAASRLDNCPPIGRTAENIPPPSPPQARIEETASPASPPPQET